jgi:hypothetical protein
MDLEFMLSLLQLPAKGVKPGLTLTGSLEVL